MPKADSRVYSKPITSNVKVKGYLLQTNFVDKVLASCSSKWKEDELKRQAEREEQGPNPQECIELHGHLRFQFWPSDCRELIER